MASLNARPRLSRRIVQFSMAVVAVLVAASATSSAQSDIGRGDPDVGDVLGVNDQGGSSLKTLRRRLQKTASSRFETTDPSPVSAISSASTNDRQRISEVAAIPEERQSSASR